MFNELCNWKVANRVMGAWLSSLCVLLIWRKTVFLEASGLILPFYDQSKACGCIRKFEHIYCVAGTLPGLTFVPDACLSFCRDRILRHNRGEEQVEFKFHLCFLQIPWFGWCLQALICAGLVCSRVGIIVIFWDINLAKVNHMVNYSIKSRDERIFAQPWACTLLYSLKWLMITCNIC